MFNFLGGLVHGAENFVGGLFHQPKPQQTYQPPQQTLRSQAVAPQASSFTQRYAGAPQTSVAPGGNDVAIQEQAAQEQKAAQAAADAARQAEVERQQQVAKQAADAYSQAQAAAQNLQDKTAVGPEMQALRQEWQKGGNADLNRVKQLQDTLQNKTQQQTYKEQANSAFDTHKDLALPALQNKSLGQFVNDYNAADAKTQEQMIKGLTDNVNNSQLTFGDQATQALHDQSALALAVLQNKGVHKTDLLNSAKDLAGGFIAAPINFAKKLGVVAQADLGQDPLAQIQADYKAGKIDKTEMIKRTNQVNNLIGSITGSQDGQDKGLVDRALRSAGMGAEGAMYVAPLVAGAVGTLAGEAAPALFAARGGLAGEAAFQGALGGTTALEHGRDTTAGDVVANTALGAGLGALTEGATSLVRKLAAGRATAADAQALTETEKQQVVQAVLNTPELKQNVPPEVAQALAPKEAAPVKTAAPTEVPATSNPVVDNFNKTAADARTATPQPPAVAVAPPQPAPATANTPAPLPKIRAYGKEIELSPENGYTATPTADGGAVYSKQTRVGTIKKGDTTFETRWYSGDGTKITGAQAKAMVDGKLPSRSTPVVRPPETPVASPADVPTPIAPPTPPQADLTQSPDYLSAKAKIEAGHPETINPAEQQAYDAVMGTPEPRGAVKRATTPKPTPEETLYNPTTGEKASSRTAERLLADPTVPKEAKGSLKKLTHDVHNDKLMIGAAKELVAKSPDTARTLFDSGDLVANNLGDSHIHLGNALVDYYNALGPDGVAEANKIYAELAQATNPAGRTMRAAQSISKISPQGIVKFAENIADKAGKPLTDDMKKALQDAALKVAKMSDGPEKEAAVKDMLELARQKGAWGKVKDTIGAVLSIPKSIMTTLDMSFGLRQGAVLGASHPVTFAQVEARSVRYAFDPAFYARDMKSIIDMTDKNGASLYPLFKKMGLAIEGVHGGSEEYFGNTSLIEGNVAKKLGVGHVVAASDRAYTGAANMLRAKVMQSIINGLGGVEEVGKMTNGELRDLGRVINTATGRGQGGKLFEQAVPALNKGLFAARFWKSRLDLLNPLYYASLKGPARAEAIRSTAAFAGIVSLSLIAAKQAGLEVEMDPRSSDFAKIKVGNTRYDILGGLQQNIVLAARELSQQTKSTSTGEVTDLNQPGGETGWDVAATFLRGKLTPVAGAAIDMRTGKDVTGHDITPAQAIAKLLMPLGVQDAADATNDAKGTGPVTPNSIAAGILKSAPGLLGVGVQTYPSASGATPGKALTPDQLNQLDPKKFDAYVKQSKTDFKNSLSPSDQALYKVYGASSDYQQKMLQDGKVTQDQLDAMKSKENRFLYDRGLPINVGMNQEDFAKFSPEEQQFITDRAINGGIKKNNAQASSDAAKAVLSKAFQSDNWPTVDTSGVTMTNALATKWIDYQKALHDAGSDQAAQYDARKSFWTAVVKQKYDAKAVDAYNLGGSTDPKNTYGMALGTIEKMVSPDGLTVNGKTYHIGKTDLDNMINLDNELLSAGLIANPKFSNKARAALGYAAAPTSSIDGVGYAGSKSSSGGGRGGSRGGKAAPQISTHPNELLTSFGSSGGLKDVASRSVKAAPTHLSLSKYENKGSRRATIKIKL